MKWLLVKSHVLSIDVHLHRSIRLFSLARYCKIEKLASKSD